MGWCITGTQWNTLGRHNSADKGGRTLLSHLSIKSSSHLDTTATATATAAVYVDCSFSCGSHSMYMRLGIHHQQL